MCAPQARRCHYALAARMTRFCAAAELHVRRQFAVIVSFARVDGSRIHDWASFHDEFNRTFAFPDFYGRNMDAWIDCMSSLDEPSAQLTGIHC
ncbi:MAG TPA: barstar family protein, partial [Steroidobacteraceae bacterium]